MTAAARTAWALAASHRPSGPSEVAPGRPISIGTTRATTIARFSRGLAVNTPAAATRIQSWAWFQEMGEARMPAQPAMARLNRG